MSRGGNVSVGYVFSCMEYNIKPWRRVITVYAIFIDGVKNASRLNCVYRPVTRRYPLDINKTKGIKPIKTRVSLHSLIGKLFRKRVLIFW
jgi:hypothetical protein